MTYMGDIVSQVGESATLKTKTSSDVNKWGDEDKSYTTETITGVFQYMSSEEDEVEEGQYEEGDIRAFLDTSELGINQGDIIQYEGTDFQVDDVQKENIGSSYHLEVRARQV